MRVSAGVREDKDPTASLPACATCISSRRSCCAQIRAESVAAHCRALLAARNEEVVDGQWRRRTNASERRTRRVVGGGGGSSSNSGCGEDDKVEKEVGTEEANSR